MRVRSRSFSDVVTRVGGAFKSFAHALRSDQATQLPDDYFDSSRYKISTSQSIQAAISPVSATPSNLAFLPFLDPRCLGSMSSEERSKIRTSRAKEFDRYHQKAPHESMTNDICLAQDATRRTERSISRCEGFQQKEGYSASLARPQCSKLIGLASF